MNCLGNTVVNCCCQRQLLGPPPGSSVYSLSYAPHLPIARTALDLALEHANAKRCRRRTRHQCKSVIAQWCSNLSSPSVISHISVEAAVVLRLMTHRERHSTDRRIPQRRSGRQHREHFRECETRIGETHRTHECYAHDFATASPRMESRPQ